MSPPACRPDRPQTTSSRNEPREVPAELEREKGPPLPFVTRYIASLCETGTASAAAAAAVGAGSLSCARSRGSCCYKVGRETVPVRLRTALSNRSDQCSSAPAGLADPAPPHQNPRYAPRRPRRGGGE